jgi:two-component system response regulator YesN
MRTIYLVDDDYLILDDFWQRRRLFEESGFEISGSNTDPLAALEEIRAVRPDVVLSDLKMPGLNGIELLMELSGELFKPLFVIISSYTEHKNVRKLFLEHGFDYLIKPVADCDLVDLLNRLAANIDYTPPDIERKTAHQKLDEILHYLNEYVHLNHTLETIAARFTLNTTSVCHIFKKHLDTTFSAHMTAMRLERAKKLLCTTDRRVKEIAASCGYGDYYYFCRVFQKENGMSPTRYREMAYEE